MFFRRHEAIWFIPSPFSDEIASFLLRNATRYSHTFSKIGNQLFALKRLGLSPISIPIPIAIANFLVGIGIRNRDRTRRFAFLFIINPDASGWFARNDGVNSAFILCRKVSTCYRIRFLGGTKQSGLHQVRLVSLCVFSKSAIVNSDEFRKSDLITLFHNTRLPGHF